jgi:hypothetical protein
MAAGKTSENQPSKETRVTGVCVPASVALMQQSLPCVVTSSRTYSWADAVAPLAIAEAAGSVQATELVSQKETGGKFGLQPLAARQTPQSGSEVEDVIGPKKWLALANARATSFDPLDLSIA